MFCVWTGDKPLTELMITLFTDVYLRYPASVCFVIPHIYRHALVCYELDAKRPRLPKHIWFRWTKTSWLKCLTDIPDALVFHQDDLIDLCFTGNTIPPQVLRNQGRYSLSEMMPYHKISWSLEAARLGYYRNDCCITLKPISGGFEAVRCLIWRTSRHIA